MGASVSVDWNQNQMDNFTVFDQFSILGESACHFLTVTIERRDCTWSATTLMIMESRENTAKYRLNRLSQTRLTWKSFMTFSPSATKQFTLEFVCLKYVQTMKSTTLETSFWQKAGSNGAESHAPSNPNSNISIDSSCKSKLPKAELNWSKTLSDSFISHSDS